MALPLQKISRDGVLYQRAADIEAAIDIACGQDIEELIRRTQIRDRSVPDYLPSECLVYLIRDARRNGHEDAQNRLLPALLSRCARTLNAKVPDSVIATAPQLREDILCDFAVLFAKDGSEEDKHTLDFYEARFNFAFRAFRISRVNSELKRLNRTKALSNPDDPDCPFDDEVLERLSDQERAVGDPVQVVFTKQIRAAIRDLPRDERDALVLCRFIRLKEESENPNERTAATVCGVTGRTIRNRLKRALAKLSKIKEVV